MDYFKHYSNASDGNTINLLMDKFGHQGYSSWFLLLELCNLHWDGKSEPKFNFFHSIVRKKLRITQKRLELFLDFCGTNTELSCEISEKNIQIHAPMLLETKERRGRFYGNKVKNIDIYRIEKEKEEEKELDKEVKVEKISEPAKVTQLKTSINPEKFTVDENGSLAFQPEDLIKLWNQVMPKQFSRASDLNGSQRREFVNLSQVYNTREQWQELLFLIAKAPLANGEVGYKATIDFIFQPEKLTGLRNGRYSSKFNNSNKSKAQLEQDQIMSWEDPYAKDA